MALAPRSSLRSLVLLLSHTKPRLSSFSSSSAADPPPRNCTLAAPAVQPPATPALPDCSSHKRPPHEETAAHPLPDPSPEKGGAVIGKSSCSSMLEYPERPVPSPCTAVDDEDPKRPTPDDGDSGSCSSSPEPVPGTGPTRGGVGSKLPGPPARP